MTATLTRAQRNALRRHFGRARITRRMVAALSRQDLMKIDQVGEKSAQAILCWLRAGGFRPAGGDPPERKSNREKSVSTAILRLQKLGYVISPAATPASGNKQMNY